MPSNILVLEKDPIYRDLTSTILSKGGYSFTLCENVEDVEYNLKETSFQLLLLDLRIVADNDFLGLKNLSSASALPIVLTTDEDIDNHLGQLMNFHINQVLSKPMKTSETLRVLERLLNPDPDKWFGLQNYMSDIKRLKRIEIKRSTQARSAIEAVFNEMHSWGFRFTHEFEMDLVWQEILINAIYHSHGYSDHKRNRIAIELPDPYKVILRFASNDRQFGVSIRDFCGSLTPARIMESLSDAVEQQNLITKSAETGEDVTDKILDRGRGLDLIRRLTGEYYFIIDPGNSTEVIIIYDSDFEKDDPVTNLKIFELPKSVSR